MLSREFFRCGLATCMTILLTNAAFAQGFPVAEPTEEHKWLEKFVGKWTTTSTALMPDGTKSPEMKGTIDSEMVGKFWVRNKMSADAGGMKIDGRQTIGYSAEKKKFIGIWVDSTADFMWHYVGSLDDDRKVLTLEAEGPDMANPGKTALYRDIYEFVSADEVKLTSSVKGPDGEWIDFMTGTSKRAK